MYKNYIHLDFIKSILDDKIKEKGILYVGNNLNEYFSFEMAEKYANTLKKGSTDREQKSSKDPINGRVAEEILIYLLENYFTHNKLDFSIMSGQNAKQLINTFKIVNEKLGFEKTFDIDIIIQNNKIEDKYFLISCKGTTRERIGQFLSNLFLMDDRLIKTKYNDRYYLDFNKKGIKIMYGFVSYDWAKTKDFTKYNPTGTLRKTIKETEVTLINDDNYIGGGVTVLNNLNNLGGIINFGELTAKIANFLNKK